MSILSEQEQQQLKIERFIFHVVGVKTEDPPTYLKEINLPTSELQDFFLNLVKATLKGSTYKFTEESETRRRLRAILANRKEFESKSRELAQDFHSRHSGVTIPGLFILVFLRVGTARFFAVLKYDRQEVVEFQVEPSNEVVLRMLENIIVEYPDALQKSALIRMTGDEPQIVLIDRKSMAKPAEYFLRFLGVTRSQSEEDMTTNLMTIAKKIAIEHRDKLPDDIVIHMLRRCYDYITTQESFNEEQFLTSICGSVAGDSPIRETYSVLLEDKELKDQTFILRKDAVKEPKKKRLRTAEGVRIIYDDDEDSASARSVKFNSENGSTIITITTSEIFPE
ncbi:MAG: nucleoid-associated protein [Candidatus Binatia bacterium]